MTETPYLEGYGKLEIVTLKEVQNDKTMRYEGTVRDETYSDDGDLIFDQDYNIYGNLENKVVAVKS
jgi:hypothetical protein